MLAERLRYDVGMFLLLFVMSLAAVSPAPRRRRPVVRHRHGRHCDGRRDGKGHPARADSGWMEVVCASRARRGPQEAVDRRRQGRTVQTRAAAIAEKNDHRAGAEEDEGRTNSGTRTARTLSVFLRYHRPMPLLLLFLMSVAPSVQRPSDIVRWSAVALAKAVAAGGTAKIELTAKIEDGWKLYALTAAEGGTRSTRDRGGERCAVHAGPKADHGDTAKLNGRALTASTRSITSARQSSRRSGRRASARRQVRSPSRFRPVAQPSAYVRSRSARGSDHVTR